MRRPHIPAVRVLVHAALLAISLGIVGTAGAANLGAGVKVTVAPTAVVSDGAHDVTSNAAIPAATTGVWQQTITQVFDPGRLKLRSGAGVVAPSGWTTTYSTDGTTYGAAPTTTAGWASIRGVRTTGALTSDGILDGWQKAARTGSLPTPASGSFTAAGNGDGWNVFFDDANHVFNVFHHDGYNYVLFGGIDCKTRTGGSCGPGWPFMVYPLHTDMRSAGYVDSEHKRLWFQTNSDSGSGFACLDISDFARGPVWCGGSETAAFIQLGASKPIPRGGAASCNTSASAKYGCVSGLAEQGGRLFTWEALTGKLLCLDMNAADGAGAPCAGQPYSFPSVTFAADVYNTNQSAAWRADLKVSEGLVYGVGGSTPVGWMPATTYGVCFDPVALRACTGWETPKALTGHAMMMYEQPNAAGDIEGVCFKVPVRFPISGSNSECFDRAGSAVTNNTGLASAIQLSDGSVDPYAQIITFAAPATAGSRVYWGDVGFNSYGALGCYDVVTAASCSGFPINTKNYALVVDPANDNCIWKNSHDGTIASYDSNGQPGCSIGTGTAVYPASMIVPRMACTGEGAVRSWTSFELREPVTGYSAASLTVRDASGKVVVSSGTRWSGIPIYSGTPLDLGLLSVADTGTDPSFEIRFTNRTNATTVQARLVMVGDAPELCLTLRAESACPAGTQVAPAPTDITGSGTTALSGSGATTLMPATAKVDMTTPSTCTGTTPQSSPAPTPMGTVNKTLIPVALPDYAKTQKGVPVRLLTLANDAGSKGHAAVTTSVRMKDPKTDTWVTSLTIDGEGTYTLDPPTGDIIFTPLATFLGTATPVPYRFEDTSGKRADSTLHVTVVTPPGPYANPDYVAGMRGETLHLVPLFNDTHAGSPFIASSIRLKDPKTGAWRTSLRVPREGTFTVGLDGRVAFKPLKTFVGTATPQTYQVTTADGKTITSTLHPVIRTTAPLLTIKTTSVKRRLTIGSQTTVTLNYCNAGGSTATKTSVQLPLPPGFAVASKHGAKVADRVATWSVGKLKPGACAAKSIVVRATAAGRGAFIGAITASNAKRAIDETRIRSTGSTPPVTG